MLIFFLYIMQVYNSFPELTLHLPSGNSRTWLIVPVDSRLFIYQIRPSVTQPAT